VDSIQLDLRALLHLCTLPRDVNNLHAILSRRAITFLWPCVFIRDIQDVCESIFSYLRNLRSKQRQLSLQGKLELGQGLHQYHSSRHSQALGQSLALQVPNWLQVMAEKGEVPPTS
jgi:hypothetical protein